MVKKAGKLRRMASSILIALLFLSLSVFAFTVQPAKAQSGETIYINPNGSITPSTANITTSDYVTYTFTGNNYLPIVVQKSGITIDGRGYTVQGTGASGSIGMNLTGLSTVTIKNMTIKAFYCGVFLNSSSGCTVSGNNITANGFAGIYIDSSSSNNSISGNNITANGFAGIYIDSSSSNNSINGNSIANNSNGIWLDSSNYNNISGNNMKGGSTGIGLVFSNYNSMGGNDITDNGGSSIWLQYSDSNSISRNNVANNAQGIELDYSSNNTISRNNITASHNYGVHLSYSSGNNMSGNTFTDCGLVLWGISQNSVKNNIVNGKPLVYLDGVANYSVGDAGQVILLRCDRIRVESLNLPRASVGIQILGTNASNISGNNIANNLVGIDLEFSSNYNSISGNNLTANNSDGILLVSSSNNTISGNDITANNYDGIQLISFSNNNSISENNVATNRIYGIDLEDSSNNSVSGNNIANNGEGVWLSMSYHNRFFHNYIIDNAQQVGSSASTNVWDDGYPSGGNYWSDYRTAYPNASEIDSSGIWNTPYVIDANNTDRYPLMGSFHTFGVGTWNGVAYNVDTVSNSTTITNLSFNQPLKTLTFDVTGTSGTTGFCRVAIPLSLMSGDWIVTVNGAPPLYLNITTYANYTYIYFTYHHSTETVQITSSISVIPEFQSSMLTALFMIITLLGAIILKRKRNAKK